MSDTPTEIQMDRINRMRVLAETEPAVYRLAFAWLSGVGSVNTELGEHIEDAIDYVQTTYMIGVANEDLFRPERLNDD